MPNGVLSDDEFRLMFMATSIQLTQKLFVEMSWMKVEIRHPSPHQYLQLNLFLTVHTARSGHAKMKITHQMEH